MKRVRAVRAVLVGGIGAFGVGCEFPTDLPILEQRWVIEVEGTTIGVEELLPPEVAVSGASFDISVDAVTTNENLGNLCASCVNSPVPLPVPAFADSFNVNQALPGDVTAAAVTGGTIDLTIDNGFTFDPLEDGGSGPGTITVSVRDAGTNVLLGTTVWDGAAGDVLPAGTSDTKTMTLSAGAIGNTLLVLTEVEVPGGQTAPTMDLTDLLTTTATPNALLVSSASVNVVNKAVAFGPEALDAEDLEGSLVDNIEEGSIVLAVTNPFGISLNGTLDVGTTSKPLVIGSGATSTVPIDYTGDQLRQILGQTGVSLGGSGNATATGPVVVTPASQLAIGTSIAFTVLIGN